MIDNTFECILWLNLYFSYARLGFFFNLYYYTFNDEGLILKPILRGGYDNISI